LPVVRLTRFRLGTILVAASCLGSGALALAASEGDDRAAASASIARLESVAAHKRLSADAVSRSRRALERARDARAAGDHERGTLLEGVAREWAEMGQDLVRAAETESEAAEAHRRATEAQAKAIRARALIEETVARRGRAAEQLEALEQTGAKPQRALPPSKPGPASPAPSGAKP
jgi:colicin import membrane protein